MAVCQLMQVLLTRRHREQARSYRRTALRPTNSAAHTCYEFEKARALLLNRQCVATPIFLGVAHRLIRVRVQRLSLF
jgi:hypothetical protein